MATTAALCPELDLAGLDASVEKARNWGEDESVKGAFYRKTIARQRG
jgi:hypothetical protein